MRIGIDLGGTKIESITLDRTGALLGRHRTATPPGYAAVVDAIVDHVAHQEREVGVRCTVGVATPGSRSPRTGHMRNANSTALNGRDLRQDLQQGLGREVAMANDANCFALSEAIDGAGATAHVVFGVILGTGVGGGVVVDKRLLEGCNLIAGEWGHNPLPRPDEAEQPGPPCYCGRSGCIETFLSGPGLARDHRTRNGGDGSAAEVAARARAGEPLARATLDRYVDRLGRALASVVNLLDPDVIVLGGGLSRIGELYASLPGAMAPHVFSDVFRTRVLPPVHTDASGARGAAWLWPP